MDGLFTYKPSITFFARFCFALVQGFGGSNVRKLWPALVRADNGDTLGAIFFIGGVVKVLPHHPLSLR